MIIIGDLMEIGSIAVGVVVGIVLGAIIFTPTGRGVTRATARRYAYHVTPKNNKR